MAQAIPELALSLDGGSLPSPVSDTSVFVRDNDGNVVVRVKNPTGAAVVVTLVATASVAGGHVVSGKQITVPANDERWLKPLPPVIYNDSVGDAYLSCPVALQFLGLRF